MSLTTSNVTLEFNPHPAQAEIARAMIDYKRVVVRAGRRMGKALALDTPIMTTNGFKNLVDVQVGDFVFSENGIPVKVLKKSEIYTGRKCYKVQFSDGSEIIADASHDWVVEPKRYRKALGRAMTPLSKPEKLTTEEIASSYLINRKDGKVEYNYSIPIAKPLQFKKIDLPIEPYFLGQWLGDGTSTNVGITTEDLEVAEYLESYASRIGGTVSKRKNTTSDVYTYHIVSDKTQQGRNNSLQAKLRTLGILGNKHIPLNYFLSNESQRLELLQGLMDSDGHLDKLSNAEFCSISKKLAEDVAQLVWSLGIKATIKTKRASLNGVDCGVVYRVRFRATHNVFRLKRKLIRLKRTKSPSIKRRYIVGVEEVPSQPVQCLTVDNPTHLFLAGKQLIATHNSSLALNIVLREALYNPGRYWIIAPEYTQAKSIYWRGLVDEYVPHEMVVKKNDNELILEIKTADPKRNSIIEFKGSDREDKLRGAGLAGVVLDEFAFQKETVWEKIISPMLLQTGGWALFITTPNGVTNHFKSFWDSAVKVESEPENTTWKTFHFTSYDYKGPDWERVHKELDEERKRMTDEYFTQEYLAEFAKFVGQIYTSFDPKVHVQNFEVDEDWTFYRSIDFGATDPNAVSFIGVDRDGVSYFFDELYINDIHTSELAELIKQKSAHRYFTATYADSAAKQSIIDLGEYGIHAIPVKKNQRSKETSSRQWIIAGINRIQQALKEKKIVIHPRCKNTITEFQAYSWRKDRAGDAVNIPEDKNNHCLAGETLVWTVDGKKPIRDLVGTEGHLYSETGKKRRFYDVRQTGVEELYKIEFDDGTVIRASAEHPFYMADGRILPTTCINNNDRIKSVTYGSYSFIGQKTAIQWKELLLRKWQIFSENYQSPKRWYKSQVLFAAQGSMGVSQWGYPGQHADKSQRLGLEEQPDRKFRTDDSQGQPSLPESRKYRKAQKTCREDTTFSCEVAQYEGRARFSQQTFQRKLEKEKADKKKMLSLWKRVRYTISDAFKLLPPELQDEGKTKKVVSVTRTGLIEPVYNLEVEDTANFALGNGAISSNCLDEIRYYFHMVEYGPTLEEEPINYLGNVVDSVTGY